MEMFFEYIGYLRIYTQELLDLIMSHWLTAVMLGIQVLYLMINAVKLKRNTD